MGGSNSREDSKAAPEPKPKAGKSTVKTQQPASRPKAHKHHSDKGEESEHQPSEQQAQVVDPEQKTVSQEVVVKLKQPEIQASRLLAFVEVFSASERVAEFLNENATEIVSSASDQVQKTKLIRNTKKLVEIMKSKLSAETPQFTAASIKDLFNLSKEWIGETSNRPEYLLALALLQSIRLVLMKTEETQMQPKAVVSGLLSMLQDGRGTPGLMKHVMADLSVTLGIEQTDDIEAFTNLAQEKLESAELGMESFGDTLHFAQSFIFDEEALGLEMEAEERSLVNSLRLFVQKRLMSDKMDLVYCQPFPIRSRYFSMDNFFFLNNLNLGFVEIDLNLIPTVSQYQVSITIDNVAQGFTPFEHITSLTSHASTLRLHRLYPKLKELARQASIKFGQEDLHFDKDCALVYQRGNNLIFTCDRNSKLLPQPPSCDHNLILAFGEPGLYSEASKVKVIIQSSTRGVNLELPNVLLCVKKSMTISELIEEFLRITRHANFAKDVQETIFSQMVVSQFVFPHAKVAEAFEMLKKRKQVSLKTSMAELKELVKSGSPVELAKGEEQVDLIIKFPVELVVSFEFLENVRKTIQNNPIYLKTELSDIWDQIFDHHISFKAGEEFEENEVRNLLPAYLYVNLENISNMINVPLELEFNSLVPHIQKLGLELNHRYRALGFIAQYKSGEYYNISIERQKAEAFSTRNGTKLACPLYKLNPNQIKAVYFERREAEV